MNVSRYWVLEGDAVVDGVSPFNRGLAYGDGLFETMRVKSGGIPLLPFHWRRLQQGLGRLGISEPGASLQTFLLDACRDLEQGVLKLIVTRGQGGRGYLPPANAEPVQIVSLHPLPHYEQDHARVGIDIGISQRRLGNNPLLAGLKHLNRLEQVLVRQSLAEAGYVEGLVLDVGDLVIEGAFSNICVITGDLIRTPALSSAGVSGVMRAWLSENVQAHGFAWQECELRLQDVLMSEEVFLCNSINGLWPVTAIEGRRFAIGPSTRVLQQALASIF